MTQEALKLALEALKTIDEAMPFPVAKLAQAAIKEALAQEKALQALHNENERLGLYKDAYAQPEQKKCDNCGEFGKCCLAQEQEPVAWSYWQSCLNDDGTQTAPWVHRLSKFKPMESIINKDVTPLYTTPPQRTWVGLTDEEELQLAGMMDKSRHWMVAEVEAKLKEKNGFAEEKNNG